MVPVGHSWIFLREANIEDVFRYYLDIFICFLALAPFMGPHDGEGFFLLRPYLISFLLVPIRGYV